MATNYDINYEDQRFKDVESDKADALTDVEKTYGGMITQSDKYFQDQINASKDWANKQTQLQNEKTDFAIEEINQQKEQAKKDYTKEQSGAYVDWQKQSNQYGADAEQKASQGMTNTGYSESSQVSMYNTYQNRIATARESYNLAVQNYNNASTEARLQNNSILAEIAYEALQKQLELSLQGFQYKNTLVAEKAKVKREVEETYYGRWQDVLTQLNTENALAEEVRQYNEKIALEKEQLAEEKRQFDILHPATTSSGGSGSISKDSAGAAITSKHGGSRGTFGSSNNSTSSNPQLDMDSVLALGFGPISAKRLAELENQGIVQSYVSGGKMKFRLSASSLKQKSLLNGMR